jgi:crotonobetainyl-CoA:carnitine CoA-transferase CaiB-like acyl-CoA transferase
VREIARTRTTDEWLAYCRRTGIPATRVTRLQDLLDELPVAEHPVVGTYRTTPLTANLSRTPGTVRRHAPLIGEHTAEVLTEVRTWVFGDEVASGPPV